MTFVLTLGFLEEYRITEHGNNKAEIWSFILVILYPHAELKPGGANLPRNILHISASFLTAVSEATGARGRLRSSALTHHLTQTCTSCILLVRVWTGVEKWTLGCAICRHCGTFRRWDLTGESKSLRSGPWGLYPLPVLSLFPDCLLHATIHSMFLPPRPIGHNGLYPLIPGPKINLSLFL